MSYEKGTRLTPRDSPQRRTPAAGASRGATTADAMRDDSKYNEHQLDAKSAAKTALLRSPAAGVLPVSSSSSSAAADALARSLRPKPALQPTRAPAQPAPESRRRASLPPRADSGVDGLIEALSSFRHHHPIYMGYRANHLSQGAVALFALGANTRYLGEWREHYVTKLVAPVTEHDGLSITRATWQNHMGDTRKFRPLLRFFEGEFDRREAAARRRRLEKGGFALASAADVEAAESAVDADADGGASADTEAEAGASAGGDATMSATVGGFTSSSSPRTAPHSTRRVNGSAGHSSARRSGGGVVSRDEAEATQEAHDEWTDFTAAWQGLVGEYYPRLSGGIVGSATHPLIQTGFAAAVLRRAADAAAPHAAPAPAVAAAEAAAAEAAAAAAAAAARAKHDLLSADSGADKPTTSDRHSDLSALSPHASASAEDGYTFPAPSGAFSGATGAFPPPSGAFSAANESLTGGAAFSGALPSHPPTRGVTTTADAAAAASAAASAAAAAREARAEAAAEQLALRMAGRTMLIEGLAWSAAAFTPTPDADTEMPVPPSPADASSSAGTGAGAGDPMSQSIDELAVTGFLPNSASLLTPAAALRLHDKLSSLYASALAETSQFFTRAAEPPSSATAAALRDSLRIDSTRAGTTAAGTGADAGTGVDAAGAAGDDARAGATTAAATGPHAKRGGHAHKGGRTHGHGRKRGGSSNGYERGSKGNSMTDADADGDADTEADAAAAPSASAGAGAGASAGVFDTEMPSRLRTLQERAEEPPYGAMPSRLLALISLIHSDERLTRHIRWVAERTVCAAVGAALAAAGKAVKGEAAAAAAVEPGVAAAAEADTGNGSESPSSQLAHIYRHKSPPVEPTPVSASAAVHVHGHTTPRLGALPSLRALHASERAAAARRANEQRRDDALALAALVPDIVSPLSGVLTLLLFASDNDFFVLHCVNAFFSLRQLLPCLPLSRVQPVLTDALAALLHVWVAQGLPGAQSPEMAHIFDRGLPAPSPAPSPAFSTGVRAQQQPQQPAQPLGIWALAGSAFDPVPAPVAGRRSSGSGSGSSSLQGLSLETGEPPISTRGTRAGTSTAAGSGLPAWDCLGAAALRSSLTDVHPLKLAWVMSCDAPVHGRSHVPLRWRSQARDSPQRRSLQKEESVEFKRELRFKAAHSQDESAGVPAPGQPPAGAEEQQRQQQQQQQQPAAAAAAAGQARRDDKAFETEYAASRARTREAFADALAGRRGLASDAGAGTGSGATTGASASAGGAVGDCGHATAGSGEPVTLEQACRGTVLTGLLPPSLMLGAWRRPSLSGAATRSGGGSGAGRGRGSASGASSLLSAPPSLGDLAALSGADVAGGAVAVEEGEEEEEAHVLAQCVARAEWLERLARATALKALI